MDAEERSKSRFVHIVCPRCKHKQVVFGKASSSVKCSNCNKLLVKPTGGRTRVKAKVKGVL